MNNSRLILGTAQLGINDYGIANHSGKPDMDEAFRIVRAAIDGGVTVFDTAQAYGDSESVLSICLARCKALKLAKIITKISSLEACLEIGLERYIQSVLLRMGVTSLHCFMLHQESDLQRLSNGLLSHLKKLKLDRIINNFGCSVYTPEAALAALKVSEISIVQIPGNIFDRRFEKAGVFSVANELNKQIHIRSVLLQGILTLTPEDLPKFLLDLAVPLKQFRDLCKKYNLLIPTTAIAWAMHRWDGGRVIFGAESHNQVKYNLLAEKYLSTLPEHVWGEFDAIAAPSEDRYYNPTLWEI